VKVFSQNENGCNQAYTPLLCKRESSCSILEANERQEGVQTSLTGCNQERYKDIRDACGLHDNDNGLRDAVDHRVTRRQCCTKLRGKGRGELVCIQTPPLTVFCAFPVSD
jgi:hypothetical protein